jgi:hypothetical protein
MNSLLRKLNYKGQQRIAIINAGEDFLNSFGKELETIKIDREIDQRYPYEFMILFVKTISEVEVHAPNVLHNLSYDGIVWFVYPKKSSKKYSSDITRDNGWEVLISRGFDKVRQISVDEDWTGLRFRNIKFIKSAQVR